MPSTCHVIIILTGIWLLGIPTTHCSVRIMHDTVIIFLYFSWTQYTKSVALCCLQDGVNIIFASLQRFQLSYLYTNFHLIMARVYSPHCFTLKNAETVTGVTCILSSLIQVQNSTSEIATFYNTVLCSREMKIAYKCYLSNNYLNSLKASYCRFVSDSKFCIFLVHTLIYVADKQITCALYLLLFWVEN